ncbi:MAG: hypothetical protein ACLU4J_11120 [Butyricimonas paravirosa]
MTYAVLKMEREIIIITDYIRTEGANTQKYYGKLSGTDLDKATYLLATRFLGTLRNEGPNLQI